MLMRLRAMLIRAAIDAALSRARFAMSADARSDYYCAMPVIYALLPLLRCLRDDDAMMLMPCRFIDDIIYYAMIRAMLR